ncbi:MAG: hypothetical protein JGK21_11415 [Microcoleus sp. PH2017_22_RUC_O_B]|nr:MULTISPECIES: hypothetical protein [unclassified Microcoleus]MCC3528792.1 hypothetical protein [Microcoleus sp. PH2017_21_RUC_O_A]MCC3540970.1 hypothetical protein [Microcoleus sp. PH2017_22_RUC_O_B]
MRVIFADRPRSPPLNSSRCIPKDIRLQPSEDVPTRTSYYRWAIAPKP